MAEFLKFEWWKPENGGSSQRTKNGATRIIKRLKILGNVYGIHPLRKTWVKDRWGFLKNLPGNTCVKSKYDVNMYISVEGLSETEGNFWISGLCLHAEEGNNYKVGLISQIRNRQISPRSAWLNGRGWLIYKRWLNVSKVQRYVCLICILYILYTLYTNEQVVLLATCNKYYCIHVWQKRLDIQST